MGFTLQQIRQLSEIAGVLKPRPAVIHGDHLWVLDEFGVHVPITSETGAHWLEATRRWKHG